MRGCAASVHNARRRKPSLPSMRSNRRAISRGIRPIWRWTTSLCTKISAGESRCEGICLAKRQGEPVPRNGID